MSKPKRFVGQIKMLLKLRSSAWCKWQYPSHSDDKHGIVSITIFVRSVGSVPKSGPVRSGPVRSGPVRSGLRSRIGLALISVQIGSTKSFSTVQNFWKQKFGATWSIFEPFEGWKIRVPLLGEFSRSSQDLYRNSLQIEHSPGRLSKFFEKWRVAF